MKINPAIFLAVLLSLPACTVNYIYDDESNVDEKQYFEDKATRVNSLLVFGPQPEETDLAALKENNIQKVISFRTPKEISELDYEQEDSLQELGIEFANIPIGGDDYPYSPSNYKALVDELAGIDSSNGQVLLHCKSGWRASVVGVAYLVKHEGMALEEAVKYAEGWWPLSLEDVLDTELVLREKQP